MDRITTLRFIGSSSILKVTRTGVKSQKSSISGQIRLFALELLALERRKFSPWTYNGEDAVDTIAPSVLIESSSNLQVTRTEKSVHWLRSYLPLSAGMTSPGIKSRTSSISDLIGLHVFALELLALEHRNYFPQSHNRNKNRWIYLRVPARLA